MKFWRIVSALLGAAIATASFGQGSLSSAQPTPSVALVLIRSADAGPSLPDSAYLHGEWILWPASGGAQGANRLLSLVTGIAWRGEGEDFQFAKLGPGEYRAANASRLQERGHFDARRSLIPRPSAAIAPPRGEVPALSLTLGLDDPTGKPRVLPYASAWPAGHLLVFEASNWDQVAALARKVGGRVLVVEPPTESGKRWTRFWTFGRGWPQGQPVDPALGIPGLIRATEAARLLQEPTKLPWVDRTIGDWGGANRWLDHMRTVAAMVLVLGALVILYAAGCAVHMVLNERRGWLAAHLLMAMVVAPAILLSVGRPLRLLGLEAWPFALLFAGAAVVGLAVGLNALAARAGAVPHPLFGVSWACLLALVSSDPRWSYLSPALLDPFLDISPEGLGALGIALAGAVATSRAVGPVPLWIARATALLILGWGVSTPWWVGTDLALLAVPVVAWVAGEGWFRAPMLLFVLMLPSGDPALRHGLVYAPNGLFEQYRDRLGLNLAQHAAFFNSPSFKLVAAATLFFAAFRDAYLWRRVAGPFAGDGPFAPLAWTAASLTALSVLHPQVLHGALYGWVACAALGLYESVRPYRVAFAELEAPVSAHG